MKKYEEYEAPIVVWMIMAIIIIAAGVYVVSSASEIVVKINNAPLWFVKGPGFVAFAIGVLVLLRCAFDALMSHWPVKQ